jgi:hypothetical protein
VARLQIHGSSCVVEIDRVDGFLATNRRKNHSILAFLSFFGFPGRFEGASAAGAIFGQLQANKPYKI